MVKKEKSKKKLGGTLSEERREEEGEQQRQKEAFGEKFYGLPKEFIFRMATTVWNEKDNTVCPTFNEDMAIKLRNDVGFLPLCWNIDDDLYPVLKNKIFAEKLVRKGDKGFNLKLAETYTILPPEKEPKQDETEEEKQTREEEREELKQERRDPEEGTGSLYKAIVEGNEFAVKCLIDVGVNVNKRNKYGYTPLDEAARNCHEACVRLLLAVPGVNANEKDSYGITSLHWAAWSGGEACLRLLLAAPGVDVNAKAKNGGTPLHWAAEYGYDACVARLLAAPGVDVNAQNKDGDTPLHMAAARGREACILLLLAAPGVDINATNIRGKTAFEVAKNENIKKLIQDEIEKIEIEEQRQSQNIPAREAARNAALSRAAASKAQEKNSSSKYSSNGGKPKTKIAKEYITYSGKKYIVRIGSKGGRYILVGADKKKIYLK